MEGKGEGQVRRTMAPSPPSPRIMPAGVESGGGASVAWARGSLGQALWWVLEGAPVGWGTFAPSPASGGDSFRFGLVWLVPGLASRESTSLVGWWRSGVHVHIVLVGSGHRAHYIIWAEVFCLTWAGHNSGTQASET